jgi:hypothetical protein
MKKAAHHALIKIKMNLLRIRRRLVEILRKKKKLQNPRNRKKFFSS